VGMADMEYMLIVWPRFSDRALDNLTCAGWHSSQAGATVVQFQ